MNNLPYSPFWKVLQYIPYYTQGRILKIFRKGPTSKRRRFSRVLPKFLRRLRRRLGGYGGAQTPKAPPIIRPWAELLILRRSCFSSLHGNDVTYYRTWAKIENSNKQLQCRGVFYRAREQYDCSARTEKNWIPVRILTNLLVFWCLILENRAYDTQKNGETHCMHQTGKLIRQPLVDRFTRTSPALLKFEYCFRCFLLLLSI